MTDALYSALGGLSAQDLAALVIKRADFDEDFREWVAAEMATAAALRTGTVLDSEPFRRRAGTLLASIGHDRSRNWRSDRAEADRDEGELAHLIEEAQPFLAAGDAANALAILIPITEELCEVWPSCASWDETLYDFFPVLDRMLAQALLMGGISDTVREDATDRIRECEGNLEGYFDDAFSIAIEAGTLGWDVPGLNDILAGRETDWPVDAGEAGLIEARLSALEAMGRFDAFLRLARACGRTGDTCVMLVKRGRNAEAIALAHAELRDADAALRLAEALWDANAREAALDLAAWALSPACDPTTGSTYNLACWLRKQAVLAKRPDLASSAAQVAFKRRLAREDYQTARTLCDPAAWPTVRADLLEHLLKAGQSHDRIDILLDEDMVAEAIAVVETDQRGYSSAHNSALKRLAGAACAAHPDWVIPFATAMATPIMDEGQSGYYDLAAQWLELAGRAHDQRDTWDEWIATLDGLIATHKRKHKLRAALTALRDKA